MRTKRINGRAKPAPPLKKKPLMVGGIMQNSNLFATFSSTSPQTFTAQLGEDGTIYKYDYGTQKNVPVGVDKKTWNNLVDEKEKYYKMGVENGYIKTPEQIIEEERQAQAQKEKEDLEFKQTMLETIKSLKEELTALKGVKNESKPNNGDIAKPISKYQQSNSTSTKLN